jgi:hypothetical protein
MRLTQGLYGLEMASPKKDLFGIYCGQYRNPSVSHNGGWYNSLGEKLGFGDLNQKDLDRIAAHLKPDEAFLVLSESDSFWKFVTHHGICGSMCATTPDEKNPGLDYVVENAVYAVLPGEIYKFNFYGEESRISRADLRKLLDKINAGD